MVQRSASIISSHLPCLLVAVALDVTVITTLLLLPLPLSRWFGFLAGLHRLVVLVSMLLPLIPCYCCRRVDSIVPLCSLPCCRLFPLCLHVRCSLVSLVASINSKLLIVLVCSYSTVFGFESPFEEMSCFHVDTAAIPGSFACIVLLVYSRGIQSS